MENISSQYLFVYGTLRSDQPEHRSHGPISLSRSIAKVAGTLFELAEGYPILKVPHSRVILSASHDWLGDWKKATGTVSTISTNVVFAESSLVKGELVEIPLVPNALSKPDKWEGFNVDQTNVYQRVVIPAIKEDGALVPAWAYISTQIPKSAKSISKGFWNRPEKLN